MPIFSRVNDLVLGAKKRKETGCFQIHYYMHVRIRVLTGAVCHGFFVFAVKTLGKLRRSTVTASEAAPVIDLKDNVISEGGVLR